jgi:GrpB-like predicted nucleotidyltransferase (UPF0157 family)
MSLVACGSGFGPWALILLFRDYVIANPAARDQYSALKRDLIAR